MKFVTEFTKEESKKIRNEFSRLKGKKMQVLQYYSFHLFFFSDSHYLDNAGSTLYAEGQISQLTEVLTGNLYCNPHTSKTTENIIDQVRFRILHHFNADPKNYSVIFTSGATASLKLVAETFQFSSENDEGSFYYLTDSHTSVLGMREVVNTNKIIPLSKDELLSLKCDLSSIDVPSNNSLFTFAAQCNYNGFKYPLEIIKSVQLVDTNYVCLDAASFVSTNHLDLQLYTPDFVCISFYKIFGYPTGLGALLVSKRGECMLNKKYYGGGTVKIASSRDNWHQKRDLIHERFEDGTIPFLSIIALQSSFNFLDNLLTTSIETSFINRVARHSFNLGTYLYEELKNLRHFNNNPVVVFYHDSDFSDSKNQGGIVNFNVLHSDGSYVGFAEFACITTLHNIILRTGCFCNPGACQSHLKLTSKDLKNHFEAGHVCGDANDLVDGIPTGSVRVSFGYMTTKEDVDKLLNVVKLCYQQHTKESSNPKNLSSIDVKKNYKLNSVKIPSKPRLRSIRIFPIKSCGAMNISGSWPLSRKGLQYDRDWIIINAANGTALTQKHETKMCLIEPVIDIERKIMKLMFGSGYDSVEIPLDVDDSLKVSANICETKICGDRIQGFDCGDEVGRWLSDVLNIDGLRLIKYSERISNKRSDISLSNQAQLLLVPEISVRWLIDQVEDYKHLDMDVPENFQNIVNRFRGNLIIEQGEAFAENGWKKIRIGNVELDVEGPCTRCQMICIDQNSGEKTTEPIRTIARLFNGKIKFGIYLSQAEIVKESSKILTCGDEITIL
ncbi:unnamed protein product [Diamesa serratosioi]